MHDMHEDQSFEKTYISNLRVYNVLQASELRMLFIET